MFRIFVLAVLLLSLTSLSCQTAQYSQGLQQSVERADEAAATSALRTIAVAQQTYAASSGGEFGTFQQLCDSGYLDSRFNSSKPTVKDYALTMEVKTLGSQAQGFFSCNADPIAPKAGSHFYIDSTSSELRFNPDGPARASDSVVQP